MQLDAVELLLCIWGRFIIIICIFTTTCCLFFVCFYCVLLYVLCLGMSPHINHIMFKTCFRSVAIADLFGQWKILVFVCGAFTRNSFSSWNRGRLFN